MYLVYRTIISSVLNACDIRKRRRVIGAEAEKLTESCFDHASSNGQIRPNALHLCQERLIGADWRSSTFHAGTPESSSSHPSRFVRLERFVLQTGTV